MIEKLQLIYNEFLLTDIECQLEVLKEEGNIKRITLWHRDKSYEFNTKFISFEDYDTEERKAEVVNHMRDVMDGQSLIKNNGE